MLGLVVLLPRASDWLCEDHAVGLGDFVEPAPSLRWEGEHRPWAFRLLGFLPMEIPEWGWPSPCECLMDTLDLQISL